MIKKIGIKERGRQTGRERWRKKRTKGDIDKLLFIL